MLNRKYANVCRSLKSFEPGVTIQPGDSPVRISAALAAHVQTLRPFISELDRRLADLLISRVYISRITDPRKDFDDMVSEIGKGQEEAEQLAKISMSRLPSTRHALEAEKNSLAVTMSRLKTHWARAKIDSKEGPLQVCIPKG